LKRVEEILALLSLMEKRKFLPLLCGLFSGSPSCSIIIKTHRYTKTYHQLGHVVMKQRIHKRTEKLP
jgi:hypothetical protein